MPVAPMLSAGYADVVVLLDLPAGGGSSKIMDSLECGESSGLRPVPISTNIP